MYGNDVNILPKNSGNKTTPTVGLYGIENPSYVADMDTDAYNKRIVDKPNTKNAKGADDLHYNSEAEDDRQKSDGSVSPQPVVLKVVDNI